MISFTVDALRIEDPATLDQRVGPTADLGRGAHEGRGAHGWFAPGATAGFSRARPRARGDRTGWEPPTRPRCPAARPAAVPASDGSTTGPPRSWWTRARDL